VVAGLAVWQVAGLTTARRGDPLADLEVAQVVRVLTAPPTVLAIDLAVHSGQLGRIRCVRCSRRRRPALTFTAS
jgi:hypothetical protein